MSEQLSLGNVRRGDPDTSHAAAARPRETMRDRVLTLFRERAMVSEHLRGRDIGWTDEELDAAYRESVGPVGRGSVGKRRQELVKLGLVEDSGKRRPTETGCTAIVWRLKR